MAKKKAFDPTKVVTDDAKSEARRIKKEFKRLIGAHMTPLMQLGSEFENLDLTDPADLARAQEINAILSGKGNDGPAKAKDDDKGSKGPAKKSSGTGGHNHGSGSTGNAPTRRSNPFGIRPTTK